MTRYTPMYVQDGSYAAATDRKLVGALWPNPASVGCAVSVSSGMTLNIAVGTVAVPTQNNTGTTLCVSDATENVVIGAAPSSGQTRIDVVICRPRDIDLDGSSNIDFIFDVVVGTAATTGSQTVPATPTGTVALCRVTVPGGAAALVAANLADVRPFGLSVGAAQALPPPLGAGVALQSFTDDNGEVWVAKGGVNSGAWKKARDVLSADYRRLAAWTIPATRTILGYETMDQDPYGIYVQASALFTAPVGGIWRIDQTLSGIPSASGQWIQPSLVMGAATLAYGMADSSTTVWIQGIAIFHGHLNAGDQVTTNHVASVAMVGQTVTGTTNVHFQYQGTG